MVDKSSAISFRLYKIQHIINVCKTFDTDKPIYVQALVDPLNWNVSIDNATKMYNELIDFKNVMVIRKIVDSDRNNDYEGVYTSEQKDFLLNWDKHFSDNKNWNDNNIVAGPLYWKKNGIEVNTPNKGIICDKYVCSCFTDLQFRKFLI